MSIPSKYKPGDVVVGKVFLNYLPGNPLSDPVAITLGYYYGDGSKGYFVNCKIDLLPCSGKIRSNSPHWVVYLNNIDPFLTEVYLSEKGISNGA